MSIVSSNMISKHYCPQCNSFDLLKLHRGFVQKHILGTENKLQCRACGEVIKPMVFDQNIPIEVPVFLETPDPISVRETTDEIVEVSSDTVSAEEVAPAAVTSEFEHKHDYQQSLHEPEAMEADFNAADDFMQTPAEDLTVTETFSLEADETLIAARNSSPNIAPPLHNDDAQLVDETILLKEKKGFWPYVLGTLVILFGAAYAFMWMPTALSNADNDTMQMDMSIVKPLPIILDKSVDVAEVAAAESDFKLAATDSQEVTVEQEVIDLKSIDEPLTALAKPVAAVSEVSSMQSNDTRFIAAFGTKADLALGGFSYGNQSNNVPSVDSLETTVTENVIDEPQVEVTSLVNVPLPETLVRQYVVAKSDQKKSEPLNIVEEDTVEADKIKVVEQSQLPLSKTVATSNVKPAASASAAQVDSASSGVLILNKPTALKIKVPSEPVELKQALKEIVFSKQAAAILGVSTRDLKILTGLEPVNPTKLAQTSTAKNQKNQSANSKLLEKVSVKFIQQDLDKLLSN